MQYNAREEQQSLSGKEVNEPKRPPSIRIGIERLQKLICELEEIIKQFTTTFSSVVFHCPEPDVNDVCNESKIPGSDLGIVINHCCDELEGKLNVIKSFIEGCDL